MDNVNLNSFLKFGYFLKYTNKDYKIENLNIDKSKYSECCEEELISIGIEKFMGAIGKLFKSNEKHVVPLSGGLDSRAILAALLSFTEARNIYTYTFGTQGTLDYDIGNAVAKKLGTNHMSFPLSDYKYTQDELVDISKRVGCQTILFHHHPVWQVDQLFREFSVWSGFMGDPSAGSHLREKSAADIENAKKYFIEKNTYVRSIDLTNCDNSEYFGLIEDNCISKYMTLEEQLDLQNRQAKYIAPHILMKGSNYKVPFMDYNWLEFIFSVDNAKYRAKQYLYKKMLLKEFKKIFSMPTKANMGLPLEASELMLNFKRAINKGKNLINNISPIFINPNINHMDFNEAFRERIDLKKVIYENIMDLSKRRVVNWVDIESIWDRHIKKQGNHADALIVLASLEIHLKAQPK